MKTFLYYFILTFMLISCSEQSELSKVFDCKNNDFENTKTVFDFNKNFKLNISKNYETKLYFDKYQSDLYAADTTKQLTSSYILITSFNFGKLEFDEHFYTKTDSILKTLNFEKLKSGNIQFKSKSAYWYLAKGEKNNFNYHQINLTVQLSENTYFNAYSEIYGDDNIDKRICEAIAIFETIEFLQ